MKIFKNDHFFEQKSHVLLEICVDLRSDNDIHSIRDPQCRSVLANIHDTVVTINYYVTKHVSLNPTTPEMRSANQSTICQDTSVELMHNATRFLLLYMMLLTKTLKSCVSIIITVIKVLPPPCSNHGKKNYRSGEKNLAIRSM